MTIFLAGDYVLLTKDQIRLLLNDNENPLSIMLLTWINQHSEEKTDYNAELLKARQTMEKWYNRITLTYQDGESMNEKDQQLWQLLVDNYEEIKKEMVDQGLILPEWARE